MLRREARDVNVSHAERFQTKQSKMSTICHTEPSIGDQCSQYAMLVTALHCSLSEFPLHLGSLCLP